MKATGLRIDRDAAQLGHRLAALVGHAGLAHHELQRPALLVVDVVDALLGRSAGRPHTPCGGK
jgi:hypothetical protein